MSDLGKIVEIIRTGRRFLIASHENPDGDAIGSTLALGLALQGIGKEAVLYNRDGATSELEFLPGSREIRSSLSDVSGNFDAAFVVDCTDTGRAGGDFEAFKNSGRFGATIIIDHHQTSKPSAEFYLLDPKASSTGMIIYSLLKKLSLGITPEIAKNLYATIVVDTGSFGYSNTSPETLRVAAELVELGADPSDIHQAIYESEPLRKIKLLGLVLPTLEITEDGTVALVIVKTEMFRVTGTGREDTEGFINFPRSIKGVEVAVLLRDESTEGNLKWKVSLRSKGKINVAAIAEKFGGGGHEKAAGCTISGTLADVKRALLNSINELL